jgi:hypothetical protein
MLGKRGWGAGRDGDKLEATFGDAPSKWPRRAQVKVFKPPSGHPEFGAAKVAGKLRTKVTGLGRQYH